MSTTTPAAATSSTGPSVDIASLQEIVRQLIPWEMTTTPTYDELVSFVALTWSKPHQQLFHPIVFRHYQEICRKFLSHFSQLPPDDHDFFRWKEKLNTLIPKKLSRSIRDYGLTNEFNQITNECKTILNNEQTTYDKWKSNKQPSTGTPTTSTDLTAKTPLTKSEPTDLSSSSAPTGAAIDHLPAPSSSHGPLLASLRESLHIRTSHLNSESLRSFVGFASHALNKDQSLLHPKVFPLYQQVTSRYLRHFREMPKTHDPTDRQKWYDYLTQMRLNLYFESSTLQPNVITKLRKLVDEYESTMREAAPKSSSHFATSTPTAANDSNVSTSNSALPVPSPSNSLSVSITKQCYDQFTKELNVWSNQQPHRLNLQCCFNFVKFISDTVKNNQYLSLFHRSIFTLFQKVVRLFLRRFSSTPLPKQDQPAFRSHLIQLQPLLKLDASQRAAIQTDILTQLDSLAHEFENTMLKHYDTISVLPTNKRKADSADASTAPAHQEPDAKRPRTSTATDQPLTDTMDTSSQPPPLLPTPVPVPGTIRWNSPLLPSMPTPIAFQQLVACVPRHRRHYNDLVYSFAYELYARAYGLEGRKREPHPSLIQCASDATGRGPVTQFLTVLYGTSFQAILGPLRSQMTLEQRKREARENLPSLNEPPESLQRLRQEARTLFERGFGLNGRVIEKRVTLNREAMARFGVRWDTLIAFWYCGLFEELDDLRYQLPPVAQYQQYGERMLGFQYAQQAPAAGVSGVESGGGLDEDADYQQLPPLESIRPSISSANFNATTGSTVDAAAVNSTTSSSLTPAPGLMDRILDSRLTVSGTTEYLVQLCDEVGELLEAVWLISSKVICRPDLIDRYDRARRMRPKIDQREMAALDDLAAIGASHTRPASNSFDSSPAASSDEEMDEPIHHANPKPRRRLVDEDEDLEVDYEQDPADFIMPVPPPHKTTAMLVSPYLQPQPLPSTSPPLITMSTISDHERLKIKTENNSPKKSSTTTHLPTPTAPSTAAAANSFVLPNGETIASAKSTSLSKPTAPSSSSTPTPTPGIISPTKPIVSEWTRRHAAEMAENALIEHQVALEKEAKEKEEKRLEKEKKRAKKLEEVAKQLANEAAEAKKAVAIKTELESKRQKKEIKAQKKEKEAIVLIEPFPEPEPQSSTVEKESKKKKKKKDQEKTNDGTDDKMDESVSASLPDRSTGKRKRDVDQVATTDEQSNDPVEDTSPTQEQSHNETEKEKKKKKKRKRDEDEPTTEVEKEKKEKKSKKDSKKEDVKVEESKMTDVAPPTIAIEPIPSSQLPSLSIVPAAAAASPLPSPAPASLKDSLSDLLRSRPVVPNFIVLDASNIAHWLGSGDTSSSSHLTGRFESWQISAAIKSVEQEIAASGLNVKVMTWLPEKYLCQPLTYQVKDIWVLLELQRQAKLHRLPTGADEQITMLKLSVQGDTFLITNDPLSTHLTSDLITPDWLQSHIFKYLTISFPFQNACSACTKMRQHFHDWFVLDESNTASVITRKSNAPNISGQSWKLEADQCCLSCLGQVFLVSPTKKTTQPTPPTTAISTTTPTTHSTSSSDTPNSHCPPHRVHHSRENGSGGGGHGRGGGSRGRPHARSRRPNHSKQPPSHSQQKQSNKK